MNRVALCVAFGVGVAAGARSVPAGVVAVLVANAARRGRDRRSELRCAQRDGLIWAQLLGALALELRAGRPPAAALLAAASASHCDGGSGLLTDLRPALLAAALPGDVGAALRRARPPPVRVLGAAWLATERRGASLAAVVTRLAESARRDSELARVRATALAAPSASARLVAALPALGVLLAAGLGARPVAFLLHDRLGQVCLLAGTLLDLAALGWSARLTRVR